jgi:hypothetical protein
MKMLALESPPLKHVLNGDACPWAVGTLSAHSRSASRPATGATFRERRESMGRQSSREEGTREDPVADGKTVGKKKPPESPVSLHHAKI